MKTNICYPRSKLLQSVNLPLTDEQKQRLKDKWHKMHSGPENVFRVVIRAEVKGWPQKASLSTGPK